MLNSNYDRKQNETQSLDTKCEVCGGTREALAIHIRALLFTGWVHNAGAEPLVKNDDKCLLIYILLLLKTIHFINSIWAPPTLPTHLPSVVIRVFYILLIAHGQTYYFFLQLYISLT